MCEKEKLRLAGTKIKIAAGLRCGERGWWGSTEKSWGKRDGICSVHQGGTSTIADWKRQCFPKEQDVNGRSVCSGWPGQTLIADRLGKWKLVLFSGMLRRLSAGTTRDGQSSTDKWGAEGTGTCVADFSTRLLNKYSQNYIRFQKWASHIHTSCTAKTGFLTSRPLLPALFPLSAISLLCIVSVQYCVLPAIFKLTN